MKHWSGDDEQQFLFWIDSSLICFKACPAAYHYLNQHVVSFNQVPLSFQWTQVRDISRASSRMRNAWRGCFLCGCGCVCLCVWCVVFVTESLVTLEWVTRMTQLFLQCPTRKEVVCNLLHLIYFYNETGSPKFRWAGKPHIWESTTFPITPLTPPGTNDR